MKFSRKMWLIIILKVTQNQGFTLSLENTFLEKLRGRRWEGSNRPPSFVRLDFFITNCDILYIIELLELWFAELHVSWIKSRYSKLCEILKAEKKYVDADFARDRLQCSLLISINKLLFPLKPSGNHCFSDDFRGDRS